MNVYPLIFSPIFKRRIWGGRRLASLLHKSLPPDEAIGESWEVADLEDDVSIVANGPAAGKTITELIAEWGADLMGGASLFEGRFPLLIKFLDACDTLSVQVHPDRAMAEKLGGRVRIKNEAWYVIHAEDDGFIYRGVCEGVDAAALEAAIKEKRVASVLNRINARVGHCYYLPSGTIHALGAGVTVAEVQTPSDITYRVYDWDRVDAATGRPRDLHLTEALKCISYDTGPIPGEVCQHTASVWTAVTSLVQCESFGIERVRMIEGVEQPIPYKELVVWIVLEGRGAIRVKGMADEIRFTAGDTVLLPAAIDDAHVRTDEECMWLEVTVPIPSSLGNLSRSDRESLAHPEPPGSAYVTLNKPGQTDHA